MTKNKLKKGELVYVKGGVNSFPNGSDWWAGTVLDILKNGNVTVKNKSGVLRIVDASRIVRTEGSR